MGPTDVFTVVDDLLPRFEVFVFFRLYDIALYICVLPIVEQIIFRDLVSGIEISDFNNLYVVLYSQKNKKNKS